MKLKFEYSEKRDFGYYVIYTTEGIIATMYSEIHDKYDIIYGVKVEEKFRNNGVGAELLKNFLELKPNKNIFLHVQTDNKYAIKLYEKFGFKITQEIFEVNKYKPKYKDIFCMKLNN